MRLRLARYSRQISSAVSIGKGQLFTQPVQYIELPDPIVGNHRPIVHGLAQETGKRNITREDLRLWYDGYHTKGGRRMYNPRSVLLALSNNNLGNYWTNSGPYDELYEDGYVSIPNKELMGRFADMVQREPSLGNVYRLTRQSGRMLMATKAGDTKTMTEILQFVHNTESPLQVYSNEAELASIIKWAYLQTIDHYRMEREDKAGVGYVDYIFYPFRREDDAIILELKVNHTADDAIRQIKERRYALRFEGKTGEKPEYTGRILAVGIAYDKDDRTKRHECKVEVLRERVK